MPRQYGHRPVTGFHATQTSQVYMLQLQPVLAK
jgi:hypothetical protein